MIISFTYPDAQITIEELPNGKRLIKIDSQSQTLTKIDQSFETSYPVELIKSILDLRGPFWLNDEIRREEDPLYVKACLEYDILAYVSKKDLESKRFLDFGCGAGASTNILARMFPKSEIVGIDFEGQFLDIARQRAKYYQYNNLSFLCSPDSKTLPENIGKFDFVLLSAVFEHLLPDERISVLDQIWSLVKPDGIFFLNQTPYRFFPYEGHTSRLFFINYLPDKLAYLYAKRYSKKIKELKNSSPLSWQDLLRKGIRGGYPRQIQRILKRSDENFIPLILKPSSPGFKDRIDIWYNGYALSIAKKYPKVKNVQRILRYTAKLIYWLTGVVFLPTVSLAIKKTQVRS